MLIPREAWGSKTVWSRLPKVKTPVDTVYLHHTVTPVTDDACADMRTVERVGLERFGQLSYSWCIHPSGLIMQGCAEYRGAHTGGRNSVSLGVAFIGNNLGPLLPGGDAINACVELIRALQAFHLTVKSPRVLPHNAVKATQCPALTGDELLWIRRASGSRA